MKFPKIRRACVNLWIAVSLFGLLCGAVGSYVWNGAQPLTFDAMCEQMRRPVNPEYAIGYVLNEVLQAEAALRRVAEQDSIAGRTAKRALYLIENGARR